jgi:beta-glucosidase
VLETWLPGDAFGPAIAGMLFGDREPGGRLPVTFPKDETQGPATHRREFPGLTDPGSGRLSEAYFDEGVFVGYRYYQAHDQKPLFPFGYGLSYGDIAIEGLGLVQPAQSGDAVRVRVTNRGRHSGTAVPQIYLGFPNEIHITGEPPRQLKAMAKVVLAPGETRVIDIPLPSEAYRYWENNTVGWEYGVGAFHVSLGLSADDIVWKDDRMVMMSR